MGRWSRLVAPEFLEWLSIPAGGRWSEVGSGTGELTRAILSQCDPKSVLRADPSVGLIERAREVVQDDRVSFEVGGCGGVAGRVGSVRCGCVGVGAELYSGCGCGDCEYRAGCAAGRDGCGVRVGLCGRDADYAAVLGCCGGD